MNGKLLTTGSALLSVLLACSVALAEGATIKVKTEWDGKALKRRPLPMNKECTEFNKGTPPDGEDKVFDKNDGGRTLRNVFVYVDNAPKGDYPVPSETVKMDQVGCVYVPHVFGIRTGQELEIHNSDPTAHNIHFTPERNPEFNKSQPKKDLVEKMSFRRAEVMVPVKCDVHPWMSAYVGVMDHPFFDTSDETGWATIEGLPEGTYKIVAWHEKYGEKALEVTVGTDETKEVSVSYNKTDDD